MVCGLVHAKILQRGQGLRARWNGRPARSLARAVIGEAAGCFVGFSTFSVDYQSSQPALRLETSPAFHPRRPGAERRLETAGRTLRRALCSLALKETNCESVASSLFVTACLVCAV